VAVGAGADVELTVVGAVTTGVGAPAVVEVEVEASEMTPTRSGFN
jgi:hypothetical protein